MEWKYNPITNFGDIFYENGNYSMERKNGKIYIRDANGDLLRQDNDNVLNWLSSGGIVDLLQGAWTEGFNYGQRNS